MKKSEMRECGCACGSSRNIAEDECGTTGSANEPKYKETPRTSDVQKDLQNRLNRAIGQLNGIKAMIDDNRYCGDVLVQLAAAEKAIRRVSEIVLQNHLETCVSDRVRRGEEGAIDEVMQMIKRFG